VNSHPNHHAVNNPRQDSAQRRTNHWAAALLWIAALPTAHAYLGGNGASVPDDWGRMQARAAASALSMNGSYTVHESTLPSGTIVHQYLSISDVVFAVTWSGPTKPDLRQLMGTHFDTMVARQAGHIHAGHPFVKQDGADLVVESAGHPGSFLGRAWLPAALPPGFDVHTLQ
jgi:Protein of unknown function (DUF2844)